MIFPYLQAGLENDTDMTFCLFFNIDILCVCVSHSVVSYSLRPHGIPQARILESIAICFSRGSSQPRYRTQVSWMAGKFFTIWTMREAYNCQIMFFPKLFLKERQWACIGGMFYLESNFSIASEISFWLEMIKHKKEKKKKKHLSFLVIFLNFA